MDWIILGSLAWLFLYQIWQTIRYDRWEKGKTNGPRPPFHPPRS